MSLKGPLSIIDGPYYLPFVDYTPTLGPRTYVLFDSGDAPFSRYLNSVIIAVSSTALTVTLSSLAVYGLTRFHHRMTWVAIALRLVAVGFFWEAPSSRLPWKFASSSARRPYWRSYLRPASCFPNVRAKATGRCQGPRMGQTFGCYRHRGRTVDLGSWTSPTFDCVDHAAKWVIQSIGRISAWFERCLTRHLHRAMMAPQRSIPIGLQHASLWPSLSRSAGGGV
jgi:hypothetical protein